jgi:hypothetical protein
LGTSHYCLPFEVPIIIVEDSNPVDDDCMAYRNILPAYALHYIYTAKGLIVGVVKDISYETSYQSSNHGGIEFAPI